jgi:hypothetical protein
VNRGALPPLKKARVIIKAVTKHQVYVEQDGERFLYALTFDPEQAKKIVQEAKREFWNRQATPMRRRGKNPGQPSDHSVALTSLG